MASPAAVVLPSEWEETFGLVVVEAMAVGVPPLASAHGSFPELVTDGVDGALFAPGDPAALGAALADADASPGQFEKYGAPPGRPTSGTSTLPQHRPAGGNLPIRDRQSRAIACPVRLPTGPLVFKTHYPGCRKLSFMPVSCPLAPGTRCNQHGNCRNTTARSCNPRHGGILGAGVDGGGEP